MIKQKYEAQLKVHANIPEDTSLEANLKYSISFRILCPIASCEEIKKNGFDFNHSQKPQWFKCKIHKVSFYAYTSWLMLQLTEIIIQRIIVALLTGKTPATSLANQYSIAQSSISRDRKSTRLNSSHTDISRMPSSA